MLSEDKIRQIQEKAHLTAYNRLAEKEEIRAMMAIVDLCDCILEDNSPFESYIPHHYTGFQQTEKDDEDARIKRDKKEKRYQAMIDRNNSLKSDKE